MEIQDIYSKRNKKHFDVFKYDTLSEKLKIQIGHIWTNFFNQISDGQREEIWKIIHSTLCEEHGKKTLLENSYGSRYKFSYKVENYFEKLTNVEEMLDVLEIVFRIIESTPKILQQYYYIDLNGNYFPDKVIKDLNIRFLENGVGFEYQGGSIIRVDNTLLHKEVIISTLQFLSSDTFKNANDEFINAHEHFRHKRNKECLNDCLKALETTMKIICHENAWQYDKKATSKALIDVCINNKLVPDFLLSHFASLRTSLESGVPTIRNKLGGHGQGISKITVPDHYASYMLYLTGTTINFLVSCQKEMKPFT